MITTEPTELMLAGEANEGGLAPASPVNVNSMRAGSGGGIGIDGVMHDDAEATSARPRRASRTERMKPTPGNSKRRSRSSIPDLRYLQERPAKFVGRP